MYRFTISTIILTFLFGCSEPKETKHPKITPEQQVQIGSFSNELIKSINDFDFSVINNSWNNEAFNERISNQITKTQQSVLEHFFDEKIGRTIKFGNLNIIHRVNSDHGEVSLLRLDHLERHSELILLLTFEGIYDFFKYRIEFIGNKPSITDYYNYADNIWYSQKIISTLRLNSKFDAFSDERHLANQSLLNSKKQLSIGDTLEALYYLYDIPESHQTGNWLSLRKLNLAMSLSDSIMADVMVTEYQKNKSLYIKYLYNYYIGDTTNLNSTYELLALELGESQTLDSLVNNGSLWNLENNDNRR